MQYISKGGFTFGIEIAGITLTNEHKVPPIIGAIKIGYHFNTVKTKKTKI
jgi:hypothetical protein